MTGHSYILYGPLANGATTLMFEGVPNYPDPSRFWQVVDKHQVSIFYTAPTAIRALMREGEDYVRRTDRRSLRILGTVGEPINPEAWLWYYDHVGERRCPIVDTWWQTETGGILITPIPGATPLKPGSATRPFFGIEPVIVDNDGKRIEGPGEGNLCLARSWPGQMRTVYGDHRRFVDTYFSTFHDLYFTGDGARRDEDGYYWITGRVDDVINVAGHRLGTAEIESALVAHPKVAEAAVVGYPHDIKGQGIYAYVTLRVDETPSEELRRELVAWVRQEISPIAAPDLVQWAPGLPKTRSGKIMRRILRKIAADEHNALGDTSTLADPAVVDDLVGNRLNRATVTDGLLSAQHLAQLAGGDDEHRKIGGAGGAHIGGDRVSRGKFSGMRLHPDGERVGHAVSALQDPLGEIGLQRVEILDQGRGGGLLPGGLRRQAARHIAQFVEGEAGADPVKGLRGASDRLGRACGQFADLEGSGQEYHPAEAHSERLRHAGSSKSCSALIKQRPLARRQQLRHYRSKISDCRPETGNFAADIEPVGSQQPPGGMLKD